MTATEFLSQIPHFDQEPALTENQIDNLNELWSRLIDVLDFHAKKWFEHDENSDWQQISFQRACDLLVDLDVTDETERLAITDKFYSRDQETSARLTDDLRSAQLKFGI